jgi:hypothetical protein
VTTVSSFLFDKLNFLMDATVGFININQNKIIKIFSVRSTSSRRTCPVRHRRRSIEEGTHGTDPNPRRRR